MSKVVGVVRECEHGYQGIHCVRDHEGSHPGTLTPDDECYCGEAAWLSIEDADDVLRQAGYVKLDVDVEAVDQAWTAMRSFGSNDDVAVLDGFIRQVLAALSNDHSTVATEDSPSVTLDREGEADGN